MAAVKINSGPIEPTDRLTNVPPDQWHNLMLVRRTYLQTRLPHDCRCLVQFVADAETMYDRVGFKTANEMIRNGLGLVPEDIRLAVDWLKLNQPQEAVPYEVVRLAARQIGIQGGKAGPGRGKKTGVINARLSSRPDARAYILARLDRDGFIDLAAKVRSNKLSAHAAAVEAGFRKKLSPIEQIFKLLPKLSDADRQMLLQKLNDEPS